MNSTRKKTVYLRLYLAYCICALVVYVLLMAFVLPWWHASNHPVVVNLGAGSAQSIGLSYSPNEDPLPLMPVGEPQGYHWKWATELPPRQSYELELVFPEGTEGEVVFKQLELIQLIPERESSFLGVNDMSEMENPGIQLKKTVDGVRIYAEPGGRLSLEIEVAATAYTWLQTWAKASFGYLLMAVALFFGLATFLQFPDRIQAYRKKIPVHEIIILLAFAVIGTLIHLHLLRYSMPVFSPGESDQHVLQAIQISKGELTGNEDGSLAVRPGYAYFLSQVAGRADWDMSAVTMAQGILFSIALTLVGLAVTRLINSWILGPVLVLAFISPPVIWVSRHIGVESLTTTLWLLGLSAFLFQWQREKWQKWLGFVLYGVIVSITLSITSSGLVMLTLPVGLLVGTFVWSAIIRGTSFWKLGVFWRTAGQVAVPVVMLMLTCMTVRLTQPVSWNLCSLPVDQSAAPFSSGMLELSAFVGDDAYGSIINERVKNGYRFDGEFITSDSGIAEKSKKDLPMRAKWVSWGHLSYWGLFLPDLETYSGQKLVKDYTVRNGYKSAADAKGVQDSIASIMRETGQAIFVQEKRSNRQVVVYNQTFVGIYKWFYRILFFVALGGWMIGLADRKHLAGLFVLPFMLNIILHVFSLNLGSEVIQSMDALLWIGALAGLLGASNKALQKPTDETDRRTMKLIRPTRLFTRQSTIPGVPPS